VAFDALGRKVAVPGIYVRSEKAPRRKFPNYALHFEKNAVQNFLEPHLVVSDTIRNQRNIEFRNLTHDLRAISTEIYHTAVSAREHPVAQRDRDLQEQIESIMAAQQMMSVRLDIVDYEVGHALHRPPERIPVFRKVEKVYKCFWNKMAHRKIKHRLSGNSFGFTVGPPILEIVPFVIIENAIKYAPQGSELVIAFEELDKEIYVYFESLGPRIRGRERSRIFEQTFRGRPPAHRSGVGRGSDFMLLRKSWGISFAAAY
jgi:K+-sensing histidine kinase KdpD